MKLWKRASGFIKDQNSIWIASLTRKTTLRNPDIERAVIRTTSHDDTHIDYKNAQKIFAWLRLSSAYAKPLVWAISVRMDRTRSWVVALKGVMLMHGVFCCQVPAIQKIGRLPFDLSNFRDSHRKNWGYSTFVRSYYVFLDQKSTFLFVHSSDRIGRDRSVADRDQYSLKRDIVTLQKLQGLLHSLLQIKPQDEEMVNVLVLEAMDCVIVEIFDVYSRVCNGIARVLMRIYSAGKVEAAMALKVLGKATEQSEELSQYFEFCREMGVIHASDCPKVEQIPESDIREMEQILNGVAEKDEKWKMKNGGAKEKKWVAPVKDSNSSLQLQTIITEKWEVFDEELHTMKMKGGGDEAMVVKKSGDPFEAAAVIHVHSKSVDLPDLISFL